MWLKHWVEVCLPEPEEHLLSHGLCLSNLCSWVILKPTSPFMVRFLWMLKEQGNSMGKALGLSVKEDISTSWDQDGHVIE